MKHSHNLGMPIHKKPIVVYKSAGQSFREMFGALRQENCKLQFIMVVLAKKEADSGYGKVVTSDFVAIFLVVNYVQVTDM